MLMKKFNNREKKFYWYLQTIADLLKLNVAFLMVLSLKPSLDSYNFLGKQNLA